MGSSQILRSAFRRPLETGFDSNDKIVRSNSTIRVRRRRARGMALSARPQGGRVPRGDAVTEGREQEPPRWLGWLLFGAIAVGTLHGILFSSVEWLHQWWLAWVRDPRWPLANPWVLFSMQVVALMWVAVARRWASRALRRTAYCMAVWMSFIGFWYLFRPENLLVPVGVSLALTIVMLLNLTAKR